MGSSLVGHVIDRIEYASINRKQSPIPPGPARSSGNSPSDVRVFHAPSWI